MTNAQDVDEILNHSKDDALELAAKLMKTSEDHGTFSIYVATLVLNKYVKAEILKHIDDELFNIIVEKLEKDTEGFTMDYIKSREEKH